MFVKLHEVSDEFLDKPYAIKQLDNFIGGNNDNIRIAASVIRNGFAHGSLTPHILNATTKKNQNTLFKLAKKLLDESNCIFTHWVKLL